jgi:hypothetical protein
MASPDNRKWYAVQVECRTAKVGGEECAEQIVPRISDDDVGMGSSKRCSGLRNLTESPGGTVRITDGR